MLAERGIWPCDVVPWRGCVTRSWWRLPWAAPRCRAARARVGPRCRYRLLTRGDHTQWLFWFESLSVASFGVAWLVNGETLFKDAAAPDQAVPVDATAADGAAPDAPIPAT